MLAKEPTPGTHTVSSDVGSNPSYQMPSGSDTDEALFFQLSDSNGSDDDAPGTQKPQNCGEVSAGSESTEHFANGGHVDGQQEQNVPDFQRERRSSTGSGSGEPRDVVEQATQGPGKNFAKLSPGNNRLASTRSAATVSCGNLRGSSLSDGGAAAPSFNGAGESAQECADTQPQSLDLAAAMRPLIPSFPEGSAEIRVRVRGISIPYTGHTLASPPYVRASLHPGAHRVARTGLPSVGPTLMNRSVSASTREGGGNLVEASPAEGVVEYRFGGEDGGGANANEHMMSLPLGSRVVDMAIDECRRSCPPRIRLEIVSGRSLGWCDLALPELMRRPGSVVRNLQVPVWRKRRGHAQAKKDDGTPILASTDNITRGCVPSHQDALLVGEICLHMGVMLSGEPWPSPSETGSGAIEFTTGTILVEAAMVRGRDTEKNPTTFSAAQWTTPVGVSSCLTLGREEPKLSTFDAEGPESNWKEKRKPGCPGAQYDSFSQHGRVTLMTTCAELDMLTLRLVQREDGRKTSSGGCLGVEQGKRRRRNALMIAVSDINDIFHGSWAWVAMQHEPFGVTCDSQASVHPPGGKAGELGGGKGGAGNQLEVLLRISLADVAAFHPIGHHRSFSTSGPPSANSVVPRRHSNSLSDPVPNRDLRVAEPPPSRGAQCSALEAWIVSPGNGYARAVADVPSQGTSSSRWATEHPKGERTESERAESHAGCSSQTGPGVVEVEVLAIHGNVEDLWPATACDGDSYSRDRRRKYNVDFPSPMWVRLTLSSGGQAGCGKSDFSTIDSPPGRVTLLERSQVPGGGAGGAAAAPLRQHGREGSKFDYTVHWAPHGGVLARIPVHWTPSQNALPVASFEVFQGQVRSFPPVPRISQRRRF